MLPITERQNLAINDIEYAKLSSMVADKLSSQIAEKLIQKTTKLTLSRPEVEIRIGFAPGSSAAREVMKDPKFPKPDAFSENGRDRWYTKDIDDYMENKRHARAKLAISAA